MIEQTLKIVMLYDFYGGLLTARQQRCLEQRYHDDLSLSEAADNLGVSRQAVHDIIKRAVETMNAFEDKLGLVERREKELENLGEIASLLEQALKADGVCSPALERAWKKTRRMILKGGG
jgi:predicted DNA-binding protein YlxM (UPF0122 family)